MLSEKEMENAICSEPDRYLDESGLKLIARQYRIGNYIFDLLFEDRHGTKLIIEIQKGTLDRNHTYKIMDYYHEYKEAKPKEYIELMVVANKIPDERKRRLSNWGITFKEIPEDIFISDEVLSRTALSQSDKQLKETQSSDQKQNNQEVDINTKVKKNRKTRARLNDKAEEDRLSFYDSIVSLTWEAIPDFKSKKCDLTKNCIVALTGFASSEWAYVIMTNSTRVELALRGSAQYPSGKVFSMLQHYREEIEKAYGEKLAWDYKEKRRHQHIREIEKKGGLYNHDWPALQIDLVSRMKRFKDALEPYLKKLF